MTDPHEKEPIALSPQQAHQMLQDDPRAVMVDIRSLMEFLFVGHLSGAVHIAWIEEPDWTVNPHFVTDIRKLLLGGVSCDEGRGCAPVILICRSGKRSLEAGRVLLMVDVPFRRVRDITELVARGAIEGQRVGRVVVREPTLEYAYVRLVGGSA